MIVGSNKAVVSSFQGQYSKAFQDPPEIIQMPNDIEKNTITIFFSSRNGEWIEQIALRKIENRWICAFRVKKRDNVLLEIIPPDFPMEKNGQVSW